MTTPNRPFRSPWLDIAQCTCPKYSITLHSGNEARPNFIILWHRYFNHRLCIKAWQSSSYLFYESQIVETTSDSKQTSLLMFAVQCFLFRVSVNNYHFQIWYHDFRLWITSMVRTWHMNWKRAVYSSQGKRSDYFVRYEILVCFTCWGWQTWLLAFRTAKLKGE